MGKLLRKILLFLLFVSTLLLAACGNNSGKSSTSTESKETSKPQQDQIELKISTQVSASHGWVTEILEPLALEIEEVTEGRVTGTVYSGGALGDPAAQFDSAVTGVADIAIGLHGYHPGDFPLTEVIELPFMATSSTQGTSTLWSLYENIPEIAEEYEGVKVIALFTGDPNLILTSKNAIQTSGDLSKLKIRTPAPVANEILETFDAVPVSIPAPDLYESMMRGVVDGAITSASAIPNFKLADVTEFITDTPVYTTSFYGVMNPDTWNKISQEDQEALSQIFGKTLSMRFAEQYVKDEEKGWQMVKDTGVEINELGESEIEGWKEKLNHIHEDWIKNNESKGSPAQKIYDEAVKISKENK